jgi:dipeptidyl aminopeptidase/acylaminoacyl peptidase
VGTAVEQHPGVPEERALRRISFRFSPHGTHGACLVRDGQSGFLVEKWSFVNRAATSRLLPTARGETVRTQPVPTEEGRVVLVRNGTDTHQVTVLSADGRRTIERTLATFDCQGLRAFPSPQTATLAWLAAYHRSGRSVIHRIDAGDLRLEPVADLPGYISGEGWLTEDGRRLAANQIVDGERRLIVLDLADGTVTTLAGADGPAVLLTSPQDSRMLVVTRTQDGPRLGWMLPGDAEVRFSRQLNAVAGTVLPLTLDPAGHRVALRVTDGARSRLLIHDAGRGSTAEVPVPPGVIGTAGWSATGLRFLFSAPTRPAVVATARRPSGSGWTFDAGPTAPDTHWHGARLERFDGPGGTIEAVVYGPDRRRAKHLLLALHGGPEAAWQLGFDPTFQRLADAGITVIAPNQRGSTGYGAAHRDAIKGAWGGPDLADIRHLGTTLVREHQSLESPRPMLFGVSYGAYLALLAAAAEPMAWSRCVVIAPFVTGSRLYEDGSPAVRSLLDRLGGCVEVDDELGPRDLFQLCPRIRTPMMIIHGERDDVIPVAHSRLLAERLRATRHRHRRPAELTYREIPHGGHNPLDEAGGHHLLEEIVEFLTPGAGEVRSRNAVGT